VGWRGRTPLSRADQGRATQSDARLDPPLTLYLDESGNGNLDQPLIVGAVACDAYADDPEEEIRALYRDLANRRSLVGLPSFTDFVENGFHASQNPIEIAGAFRETLQQKLHFKLYMIMTDRTSMSPMSERGQLKELYLKLVSDILLSARRRVSVACVIEQNDDLRGFVTELPRAAYERASKTNTSGDRVPPVTARMAPKMEAMLATQSGRAIDIDPGIRRAGGGRRRGSRSQLPRRGSASAGSWWRPRRRRERRARRTAR
jgi:hypothetical protein